MSQTRQFETGATRDSDSSKLDYEGFISPLVDRRYAEYMHEYRLRNIPNGQTIRSSDNWQKGMPLESYAKSLVRHVNEFRLIFDGFEAFDEKGNKLFLEDVLCAIRFNVDGYLFELLKAKHGRTSGPEWRGGADYRAGRPMPELSKGQSLDAQITPLRDMSQKSPYPVSGEGYDCARPDGPSGISKDDGRLAKISSRTSSHDDRDSEWRSQGDGSAGESYEGYHESRVWKASSDSGRKASDSGSHSAPCS